MPDYPSVQFLLGKVLNALLLDPVGYDLQVLERFNVLLDVLTASLTPSELERVHEVLRDSRGARYRRLDTLVFAPSTDIGKMAGEHVGSRRVEASQVTRWLLGRARSATGEADLLSYLLFDGTFANRLIELGRADVRARADEVRAFFTARSESVRESA